MTGVRLDTKSVSTRCINRGWIDHLDHQKNPVHHQRSSTERRVRKREAPSQTEDLAVDKVVVRMQ